MGRIANALKKAKNRVKKDIEEAKNRIKEDMEEASKFQRSQGISMETLREQLGPVNY